MNSYLSKEEKQHFVRAAALVALIEETINGYASAKSTDPGFLKYLRMGRTMIGKALTMRGDALDPSAKEEFYKQTGRLEFICVPRSEAKKEYAQLLAMQSTIPMETKDFEDWYCSVIETTCKKCCTEEYAECQIRGILTKYGVYPIDPTAVGKCQFSYVGTPEAEELRLANADIVPAAEYNQAVTEISILKSRMEALKQRCDELKKWETAGVEATNEIVALRNDLRTVEEDRDEWIRKSHFYADNVGEMKKLLDEQIVCRDEAQRQVSDLQARLQATAASQEQPKEEYPVSIGLASGGGFDYVLPAHMAEIMIHEIQRPRHSRGTCAQYVGGSLVAIDLQEVVALHVDKLPPKDWVKPKEVQAVPGQQEKYRVECKCGAEYYAEMNAGRTKAWCRECKTTVFADRSAEVSTADGAAATLLTNRYWVEREQPAERRKEIPAQEISNNFGKEYKDPINPLA